VLVRLLLDFDGEQVHSLGGGGLHCHSSFSSSPPLPGGGSRCLPLQPRKCESTDGGYVLLGKEPLRVSPDDGGLPRSVPSDNLSAGFQMSISIHQHQAPS